jgi:major membrane immunogen (membrane-anchored lipoprotein)
MLMAFISRSLKWCCGFALSFGLAQSVLAGNGAPFPETMPFLPVLLQDDAAALAKGFHREKLGYLNLPSGKIVALDPLVMMGKGQGFTQTVAAGRYQVSVFWFDDKDWGKRNAFATLTFSNGEVATWQMAVTEGQDIAKLKPDEFYGYGVDAGMGSFLSPEGFKALNDAMDKAQKEIANYSSYYDDVLAIPLDALNPSRLIYEPPTAPENNIAMFASGFGDGSYPSYFGMDAAGKPVILVTTFLVVDQPPASIKKAN